MTERYWIIPVSAGATVWDTGPSDFSVTLPTVEGAGELAAALNERSEWTTEDARSAIADGWDVFDCDDSVNGPWQIQSFDSPEDAGLDPATYPFAADEDVWAHVVLRAAEGSALHARALAFVAEHNPTEYRVIIEWVETH